MINGELFLVSRGFVLAIHDHVISGNAYYKDNPIEGLKCCKCDQKNKSIQHVTTYCTYVANSDYLYRYHQICNII